VKDREGKGSCYDPLVFDERIASLGTLAAGFAHEINNPLADLSIQLELLEEEIPALVTDPLSRRELTKLVTQAIEGAQRIRKFSQGLQLFSRAPDHESRIFELHEVIEQSIDVCFHEIRQRAGLVTLFEDLPCIRGNSARLGQVFVHLLMNAAEAIPAGDRDENEITISTSKDEESRVVVTVHDTGCGVPKKLQTRIFEPFFTTKDIGQGVGVGLSVSHSIVAEMGGELSVESKPGQGCTFAVVLPPARAEEPVVHSPDHSKQTAGASILVVDDEPSAASLLERSRTTRSQA
jgi:signal transduction histidine kinase